MMKGEGWVDKKVKLQVVLMENWKRNFLWDETGLTWIPPSPNMPSPETALAYPGTGLSLGDGQEFGLKLEEISYKPRSLPGKVLHPPYENRLCHGIYLRFSHEDKSLSVRFALALIKTLKEYYPKKIKPRRHSLNLLFGSDLLVRYLEGKINYKDLLSKIEQDENFFRQQRSQYLLYH